MKHSAYQSLIAPYYLEPLSAEQVAFAINARLRSTAVTAKLVSFIFAELSDSSVVYRELGDRPANGFPPSDMVTVARKLLAA
jgi:hypothetical protein